jgi:hypothetical protein
VAEEEGCDGDDAWERTCLHGLLREHGAGHERGFWFGCGLSAGRAMRVGL